MDMQINRHIAGTKYDNSGIDNLIAHVSRLNRKLKSVYDKLLNTVNLDNLQILLYE